jgi:hypothetical protein
MAAQLHSGLQTPTGLYSDDLYGRHAPCDLPVEQAVMFGARADTRHSAAAAAAVWAAAAVVEPTSHFNLQENNLQENDDIADDLNDERTCSRSSSAVALPAASFKTSASRMITNSAASARDMSPLASVGSRTASTSRLSASSMALLPATHGMSYTSALALGILLAPSCRLPLKALYDFIHRHASRLGLRDQPNRRRSVRNTLSKQRGFVRIDANGELAQPQARRCFWTILEHELPQPTRIFLATARCAESEYARLAGQVAEAEGTDWPPSAAAQSAAAPAAPLFRPRSAASTPEGQRAALASDNASDGAEKLYHSARDDVEMPQAPVSPGSIDTVMRLLQVPNGHENPNVQAQTALLLDLLQKYNEEQQHTRAAHRQQSVRLPIASHPVALPQAGWPNQQHEEWSASQQPHCQQLQYHHHHHQQNQQQISPYHYQQNHQPQNQRQNFQQQRVSFDVEGRQEQHQYPQQMQKRLSSTAQAQGAAIAEQLEDAPQNRRQCTLAFQTPQHAGVATPDRHPKGGLLLPGQSHATLDFIPDGESFTPELHELVNALLRGDV